MILMKNLKMIYLPVMTNKKLVDDAEEKNMWGQKQKKNIMILEPTDWNYKNVESRCDYEWEQNKK